MKKLADRARNFFKGKFKKFKSLTLKKKIAVIIAVILLLFILLQSVSALTQKPPYTITKVEKGELTEVVSETGNISTTGKIEIYSPTNGVVEDVFVENGQYLEEGEELFAVNSSATVQEQQAAYSNYLLAVSGLNSAKSTLHTYQANMFDAWDTYKNLAENDTYENSDGTPKNDKRTLPEFQIAQKEWLAAEAKYADQKTAIAQGQADVSSKWELYQATQNSTVKAPVSGTVSNISVPLGNSVKIKSQTDSSPVLYIADFSVNEAVLSLSETDIAKIKRGQRVKIDVKAVRDKDYDGIIRRVDDIGTEKAGVVRYNAYIEVLSADTGLKPGMSVDVEIVTKRVSGVLLVPNSSVKPYQGGRAVRVVDKRTGEIEYVSVITGVKGKTKTEIIKGLSEGQEIVESLSNEQIKRPSLF